MLQDLSGWLAQSPASLFIQETLWIVPAVQSLHILAIAFLLFSAFSGSVAVARGGNDRSVPWLPTSYRWTWGALLVLLATGTVLVVGEPGRSLLNLFFQAKMVLVLIAAGATLALQRLLAGQAARSASLKALAAIAVLAWIAIVFCGRLIAYFGNPPA